MQLRGKKKHGKRSTINLLRLDSALEEELEKGEESAVFSPLINFLAGSMNEDGVRIVLDSRDELETTADSNDPDIW